MLGIRVLVARAKGRVIRSDSVRFGWVWDAKGTRLGLSRFSGSALELQPFPLDPDGTTGFAVSRRVFGGAKVERGLEGVTVSAVVGPNDIRVVDKRR